VKTYISDLAQWLTPQITAQLQLVAEPKRRKNNSGRKVVKEK
jgi:hypothetical protein